MNLLSNEPVRGIHSLLVASHFTIETHRMLQLISNDSMYGLHIHWNRFRGERPVTWSVFGLKHWAKLLRRSLCDGGCVFARPLITGCPSVRLLGLRASHVRNTHRLNDMADMTTVYEPPKTPYPNIRAHAAGSGTRR